MSGDPGTGRATGTEKRSTMPPVYPLNQQSTQMAQPEYVYAVTNKAMPGLVKIGMTSQDPEIRIAQLFTTAVPFPFDPVAVVRVMDGRTVERLLARVFGPARVNSQREFFKIDVDQVEAAMGLLGEEADVMGDFASDTEEESHDVDGVLRRAKKRPNLDFHKMGIANGSELVFAFPNEGEHITATVVSYRKVLYAGEEMYLTPATQRAMGHDKPIPPTGYWEYEGRLLKEIYDKTFPQDSKS